jgi:hypothetical protein
VGWGDVETKLLDQAREPRSLALGELQNKPRESRRVDDRMQQRALQAAAHQPGVERIVAVLDEDGALGEAEERAAGVTKFGGADQHRPVDVVPLLGVGVDRRAAIDERVEKGKRARQLESLCAQLEHQEWRVASRFDVDGHELRLIQIRLRAELRRIDCDFFPRHRLGGSTRLQEDRFHV